MAFITFTITGIIAPGQFYTAGSKSARNASLLVGTKFKKKSPVDYANERAKYAQFFIETVQKLYLS